MALEHALATALSERAGTGYELARRFDRSIGQFWSATHQQIYRVLARMETDGWVTSTAVAQHGRPDKKVYRITPTGRAALAAWVREPAELDVPRSELSVKIRAAGARDRPALRAEVGRHRDLRRQRLEAYLANEQREFSDPDALRGREVNQYLVLRGGIALERALIAWLDEVLDSLERLDHVVGAAR